MLDTEELIQKALDKGVIVQNHSWFDFYGKFNIQGRQKLHQLVDNFPIVKDSLILYLSVND